MKAKIGLGILLLVGFLSVAMTVNSKDAQTGYDEAYYDTIESDYMDEVRAVLRKHAYYFSGITMTKITEEDGSRSYQVRIHDAGFSKLTDDQKEGLIGQLAAIHFADQRVTISHELEANIQ